MSYDAYRKLRFKNEQSTWRDSGTPFELRYFPLGRSFTRPLTLHEVVGDEVKPLRLPPNCVRRHPLQRGGRLAAASLGGRAAAQRGGRRLPRRELLPAGGTRLALWPVGPRPGRRHGGGRRGRISRVHDVLAAKTATRRHRGALLSRCSSLRASPAPTLRGAAERRNTVAEVRARLILRAPVARLGIAPLTSMFLGGENQPPVARLPARGARLRRPAGGQRQRRVAVAAAHQPARRVRDQLRDARRCAASA